MRIGIFGGTFDPPHLGHLIAAQDACAALSLDRLLFMPAAQPPHKRSRVVSDAHCRLEMLRAAVADNASFEICTIELERGGPSYTVDTLRDLKNGRFRDDALYLLVGVDQIREFNTWHAPQEILRLANVVMLTRAGTEATEADFVHDVVAVTRIDISSTLLRQRVAQGASIRYMVPPAVEAIVEREQLYRAHAVVSDRA